MNIKNLQFVNHWYWNQPVAFVDHAAVFQDGFIACCIFECKCTNDADCIKCKLLDDYCKAE